MKTPTIAFALMLSACDVAEVKPIPSPVFGWSSSAETPLGCYRTEWGPWKCSDNLRVRMIASGHTWECFMLEEKRGAVWRESETIHPVCAAKKRAK